MILRFKLYCCAAAAASAALPSSSLLVVDAFAVVPSTKTSSSARFGTTTTTTTKAKTTIRREMSLNPDWDNADFLSSLGGSKDQMDEANDDYYRKSENRAAMDAWRLRQMTGGGQGQQQQQQQQQQPPPPTLGQQQPPVGGFAGQPPAASYAQYPPPPPPQQQMQTQMQQQPLQQQQQQPPLFPPQYQQPYQQQQPPPPQQQQFYDAAGNPVSLPMVYDAYGNLVPYNPFPANQQQQQQQQQPIPLPPPGGGYAPSLEFLDATPLPPKTKGTDVLPRPAGFNPDAFAMSNTADVYFAQLKQDSKVRKLARMSGDTETANRVFADETVKMIGDSWQANPYTKEKNIAEARAEIEGAVRMQVEGGYYADEDGSGSTNAVSYREKLALMKSKRSGGGGMPTTTATPPPAASAPPRGGADPRPSTAGAVPPAAAFRPPVGAAATPPRTDPAASSPPPPPQVGRTSGIGAAPPLPSTNSAASTTAVGRSAPTVAAAAPSLLGRTAPTVAAAAAPSSPVAATPVVVAATDEEDVRRKVRTLQGLLLKHRGGPGFGAGRLRAPEARRLEETLEEVTGILRAELGGGVGVAAPAPAVSAPAEMARTAVPAATTPPTRTAPAAPAFFGAATAESPTVAAADPLAGSVACVEAVLRMYKESDPAERESMIVPLREALMAAASASNKYIAEAELSAHRSAMEAGPATAFASLGGGATPARPMMGFPTSYDVTDPREEGVGVASTPMAMATGDGRAANDKKLEEVYSALLNARGDGGKLGLKNISGNEANDLSDKLVAMRSVLLDELNNGT